MRWGRSERSGEEAAFSAGGGLGATGVGSAAAAAGTVAAAGVTGAEGAGAVSLAAVRALGLGDRLRLPRLPAGFLPENSEAGRPPGLRGTLGLAVAESEASGDGEAGRSGEESLLTGGKMGGS